MPLKPIFVAATALALAVGAASAASLRPQPDMQPARDAAARSAPPREAPRPLVLLVHGRGHAGLDTAALRRGWQAALNAGARSVTGRSLFRDGDVSLVWYADALDPLSPARCSSAELARYRRAAGVDEGLGALLQLGGVLLAGFTDGAADAGARELRAIGGELQYFTDVERRCASEQRLSAALRSAERQQRPVVLVAHSMGALLSWSFLEGHADARRLPRIERFVTVGSLLGSATVRQLLFGAETPALTLPTGVRSWVNVVEDADPLAVPLRASSAGLANVTTRGRPADDPHRIDHYLRDPATATAVIEAWCGGFRAGAPNGCGRAAQR